MTQEQEQLGFKTLDDWSVHEFHAFFHQINILYNRIYVLDEQLRTKRVRKIGPLLYGSLSKVEESEKLYLESITIHSPGEFNLKGAGGILRELREFWKDFRFRNKIEKASLEEALRHAQSENILKEQKTALKLINKRIKLVRKLGYDDDQIKVVEKALGDPMIQLIVLSERKGVESIPVSNETAN